MEKIIEGINNELSTRKLTIMDLWRQNIEGGAAEKVVVEMKPTEDVDKLMEDIRTGKIECPECASRRYVDQSDDPSVSFQTPQKVSPSQAKSAVMSHEREHVVNENAKAKKENKEVVSSNVTLHYARCSTCGASYVSGGTTSTVTREKYKREAVNFDKNNLDVKA